MNSTRRNIMAAMASTMLPPWKFAQASALNSTRAQTPFTGRKLVFSQSAAKSGISALLGTDMECGINAGFQALNDAGTLPFELVLQSRDDGYEADRCQVNTKDFIERSDTFGLIGFVGTPTCLAVLDMVEQAGIPMVGPYTGAEAVQRHRPGVFHTRTGYNREAEVGAMQLLAYGAASKILILRQSGSYGDAVEAAYRRAIAVITSTERDRYAGFNPATQIRVAVIEQGTINVDPAIAIFKDFRPTSIAIGSVYRAVAVFLDRLGPLARPVIAVSVSFLGTRGFSEYLSAQEHARQQGAKTELLGPVGGVGITQTVPFIYDNGIGIVARYQKAMANKYGNSVPLSPGSLEGFIAAMATGVGVSRCGERVSRQRFAEAMEVPMNVGGFDLPFAPNRHAPSQYAELTMLNREGRLKK